jgi:predicted negative regulator of RcsB-dependent stress response
MPDMIPSIDNSRLSSWFTANLKLTILGAVVIVLGVAAGLTWWRPWAREQAGSTNQTNTKTTGANQNTNSTRATFERFQAVVNRPDTNVNTTRPTKEETARAIQQLNQTSH